MKHGSSLVYTLGLVALISLAIVGIGIKQKKKGDIIVGTLILILSLVSCLFELFS